MPYTQGGHWYPTPNIDSTPTPMQERAHVSEGVTKSPATRAALDELRRAIGDEAFTKMMNDAESRRIVKAHGSS